MVRAALLNAIATTVIATRAFMLVLQSVLHERSALVGRSTSRLEQMQLRHIRELDGIPARE
jgi:hypothetical protein